MSERTAAEKLARLEELKHGKPGFASLEQRVNECREMLELAGCGKVEDRSTLTEMVYTACREILRQQQHPNARLIETSPPTHAEDDKSQDLVRLGTGYTEIRMSKEARDRAMQAALWRTASPHEWEWTPEQQAYMALYVLWATQRLEMLRVLAEGAPVPHTATDTHDS